MSAGLTQEFFIRALLGGIGVALIAGPLGCFLVWRRMAFFGAALSHSALLGVALGFALHIDLTVAILAYCLVSALLLLLLERQRLLPGDTLLGILAHAALALGIVVLAFMTGLRVDLLGYLFGDVLAVSRSDLVLIYGLATVAVAVLVHFWRSLLSSTVSEELAAVEGLPVARARLAFVLLVAAVIAIGMKVVGMLLIVSLLIVPAAAARRFASTPEQMALGAAAIGTLSVIGGLLGSLRWDVPAGPSIVVMAVLIFAAVIAWPRLQAEARGPGT